MANALIIDDNRELANYLRRMLDYLGIESEVAYGPLTGMLKVSKVPDVVLLDIHMPGMDGFEVLAYIRRQPGFDRVPVIIVTADDQPETERKARDTGALALILKPFTMEALETHLRDLGLI